jgi:hypothetical protein
MGMLSAHLRVCPVTAKPSEFCSELRAWIQNKLDDERDSYESFDVKIVSPAVFDEIWSYQETYKDTPEIKEKYRKIADEGRLIYAEIDF